MWERACPRRAQSGPKTSKATRPEGIAAVHIALGKPGLEPAHPLRRGAMGEGVRHHAPLTLLLQPVITNGIGGIQRLFNITRLQPVQSLLRLIRPDAGQAVRLQFLAHQQAIVAFKALATAPRGIDLGRHPNRVCTWWPISWAIT